MSLQALLTKKCDRQRRHCRDLILALAEKDGADNMSNFEDFNGLRVEHWLGEEA